MQVSKLLHIQGFQLGMGTGPIDSEDTAWFDQIEKCPVYM